MQGRNLHWGPSAWLPRRGVYSSRSRAGILVAAAEEMLEAKGTGIVGFHGSTRQAHSCGARNARDGGEGNDGGEKLRGRRVERRAVLELSRRRGRARERREGGEGRGNHNNRTRRAEEEEDMMPRRR